MVTLDEGLALTSLGDGAWSARSHAAFVANPGVMFGGWTAALLLKAVMEDGRAKGVPCALTVHYLKPIPPDVDVQLKVRPLGGSRAVVAWQADLLLRDTVAAVATVIMGERRDTDGFTEGVMPEAPDPKTLPMFHPPAPFGDYVEYGVIGGFPPFNQPDTRSQHWARQASGRAMDYVQIAYLADAYPPRVFYKGAGPRPFATLTLSIYFYATASELGGVDNDFVLCEAVGTCADASLSGQQWRVWSRQGRLLATSEQLGWFK